MAKQENLDLRFDPRDGTYHFEHRTKKGCSFYSQDFPDRISATEAYRNGKLVNQVEGK